METTLLHHQIRKAEKSSALPGSKSETLISTGKLAKSNGNNQKAVRNVCAHLMRHVLMNLLKKQLGPNPWQANPLVPIIWNIGKLPSKKKVIPRNGWTHLMRHQLMGLSPTIWMTSTILPYGILVQMQVLQNYTWNYQLKPLNTFVFKYRTQDTSTAEEKVPAEYHEYLDVFKEEVECFPESRPWDHAIEMKPRFEPQVFKLYNLTLEECGQQELFIKENLKKGYIRPSRSPMASPFFFVNKKDGKL